LLIDRFWCAVPRHRLFGVFSEARIFNRSGRFPLILRVARTPVGERAPCWCAPAPRSDRVTAKLIAAIDDSGLLTSAEPSCSRARGRWRLYRTM
jgi:hypothetical protein